MPSPFSPIKPADEEAGIRLAILIDTDSDKDSAQPKVIEALLKEVVLSGEANVRRIAGDFTAATSASWKPLLNK